MKCLTLVVNQSSQGDIAETLRLLPEVGSYTVLKGEGYYGDSLPPFESSRDEVMGYIPRIRIDLVLEDDKLGAVLEHIKKCGVCSSKLGVYWVTPVDEIGSL